MRGASFQKHTARPADAGPPAHAGEGDLRRFAWREGFVEVIAASRRLCQQEPATGGRPRRVEEAAGAPGVLQSDGAVRYRPADTGWGSGTVPGGCTYFYRRVPSTNDRLRELLVQGAVPGTLVVAEEQSAGRGRHGRQWYSPPGGGLYASLFLQPAVPVDRIGWIPLAAALALVRVAKQAGVSLDIKWPNDVECDGKKVAGILAETVSEGDRVHGVILGTGINVDWELDRVPEEIRNRGTALSLCASVPVDRDRLLADYLWEFWAVVDELEGERGEGLPAVASEVMSRMVHLGEQVLVRAGEDEISGICTGLTREGYLQLDGGRSVVAGELITRIGNGDS